MPELAIVGGTGVYEAGILEGVRDATLVTPYGTVRLQIGRLERSPEGQPAERNVPAAPAGPPEAASSDAPAEVAFLPRHGMDHGVPPHRINYRANVWALHSLGVRRIVGTGAVGSLRLDYAPGEMVLVDQLLDFTRGRPSTFFDGEGAPGGAEPAVVHTDMTEPYCPELRRVLAEAAAAEGALAHGQGCYVCTEGPRFETAAEIRMFRQLGADVVGMTNAPEVVLARELGMCYGLVAMVTNYGAGLTGRPLTHGEVVETMRENVRQLRLIAWRALGLLPAARGCACGRTEVGVGRLVERIER